MKIVSSFILIIIFICFNGLALCEDALNGYSWEKMDDADGKISKLTLITGYLVGYESGYFYGTENGSINLSNFIYDELIPKFIVGESKQCADILISKKQDISMITLGQMAASIHHKRFNESPNYYIRELDSFYKTYPLCKSRNLPDMLFMLSQVWDRTGKYSYKIVGEECLKNKK
jgi:hypothetical protein